MHQPYYKDPFTGVLRLPWVRLHGTKDYLDMVEVLAEFPRIHQTLNIVPSLMEQIIDYTDHGTSDIFLDLTMRDPASLTGDEKVFVIENFFLANWDHMIKPLPRYHELLLKRGTRFAKRDMLRAQKYFSDDDIRDLQVLFNLSWIDPLFRKRDPFLSGLIAKGRDFTEDEKALLIDRQLSILREIIPGYRRARESGQVEISVSPYFHPILPLLWDTDAARRAMPHVALPSKRFSYPEDAERQIQMAISFYEGLFGARPSGMWPSEGSVSEEIARVISSLGIRWIATDEEVLAHSLERPVRSPEGHVLDGHALYSPHEYGGLSICFRDHRLSDLIGFVYSSWTAESAARDFVDKLLSVRQSLPDNRAHLVSIILDGENAWEYYPNDGQDFLRCLYDMISRDSRFRAVTISEFINEHGSGDSLGRLHCGSWINANFGIWIGHAEDNAAWDYLAQTREDLEKHRNSKQETELFDAWKSIYAAEGSDWNWWYGDDHSTETQEEFDELFRSHLMKVYKVLGLEVPHHLFLPILLEDRSVIPSAQSRGFVYPKIDGIVTSYYEWYQGACIEGKRSGGSMHRSEGLVNSVYYGFNKDNFYVRIDPAAPFTEIGESILIVLSIIHGDFFKIVFDPSEAARKAVLSRNAGTEWETVKVLEKVAAGEIFEIEVPFGDIAAGANEEVHFFIDIVKKHDDMAGVPLNNSMERYPWRGHITFAVPSEDYEKLMWY